MRENWDWRVENAELLATPSGKKRMIINHRLIREGDGNAEEMFAMETALKSERWRGGRSAALERLGKLAAKDKNTVILPGDGEPCSRCSSPTEIREHVTITPKLLKQSCYFTRWYICDKCDVVI